MKKHALAASTDVSLTSTNCKGVYCEGRKIHLDLLSQNWIAVRDFFLLSSLLKISQMLRKGTELK